MQKWEKDIKSETFDRLYKGRDLEFLNLSHNGQYEFYEKDGHIYCHIAKEKRHKP